MQHRFTAHAAAPLIAIFLTSALGAQAEFRPAPIEFERISDSGRFGAVELAFDDDDFLAFRERSHGDRSFRIHGFPLPGGERVGLELRPVSAIPAGARAQVVDEHGRVRELAARVLCFSGALDDGGSIFFGLTRTQAHGYLYHGGELYFLSSAPGARPGRVTLAHCTQVGTMDAGECQSGRAPLQFDDDLGDFLPLLGAPTLRTADVFVEADNAYRALFASDQDCVDYTTLLFTAASEIYRRDIGVELRIPNGYLRVWNTTPPWGAITGFSNLKVAHQAKWKKTVFEVYAEASIPFEWSAELGEECDEVGMLHAVDAHGRYAGFGFALPDLRSVEDQSRGHPARPIEG